MENEVRVGWELRKVLDTFSGTEVAIAVSFGRSLEDVYKPYLASTRVLQDVMKAAAAKVLKDRHGSSHEFWLSVLENLDSLGSEPWTTNPVQVPTTPHQMSSQPSYQNSNIPPAPPKPTNRVKNNKPHIQPVPLLTRFAFIASSVHSGRASRGMVQQRSADELRIPRLQSWECQDITKEGQNARN